MLLYETHSMRPVLTVLPTKGAGAGPQHVQTPDWCTALEPAGLVGAADTQLALLLQSPAVPPRRFTLDLNSAAPLALRPPFGDSAPPPRYQATTEWARGRDGTSIPITLVRSGAAGPAPVLVDVYGAYGLPLRPMYSPVNLALLEQGWSVAVAHVRGGGELQLLPGGAAVTRACAYGLVRFVSAGELGRKWHAQGRLLQKENSVLDCLACLEHLFDKVRHLPPCANVRQAASPRCLLLPVAAVFRTGSSRPPGPERGRHCRGRCAGQATGMAGGRRAAQALRGRAGRHAQPAARAYRDGL